jgi:nucleoid-associated protein YgaU
VREAKAEAAGAPALAPAPSSAPATPAPASVPSASADVEKAAPGSPASKIHVLLQTAPEAPPPQASCAVLCCAMLCCASCPCVCCPCVMSLARNLEAVLAMAEPLLLTAPITDQQRSAARNAIDQLRQRQHLRLHDPLRLSLNAPWPLVSVAVPMACS